MGDGPAFGLLLRGQHTPDDLCDITLRMVFRCAVRRQAKRRFDEGSGERRICPVSDALTGSGGPPGREDVLSPTTAQPHDLFGDEPRSCVEPLAFSRRALSPPPLATARGAVSADFK